jgi:acetyl-CoA synthetase
VALAAGWEPNEDTAFQTISGKIRRVELRAREQAAADSGRRIESEWRDGEFSAAIAHPR